MLGIALLLLVRDSPYTGEVVERIKIRALARTMAEVWGNPGTRLGLWVHFSSQFGPTVFTMLWGYPFLIAQGLESTVASGMLILMTVTAMVAGPLIGVLTSRVPYHRSSLVLLLVAAIAPRGPWCCSGRAPHPCAARGHGDGHGRGWAGVDGQLRPGPHLPPLRALRPASGMINVGGFVASLMTIGLIGLILDHRSPAVPRPTSWPTSGSRWRCSSRSGPSEPCSSSATAARGTR